MIWETVVQPVRAGTGTWKPYEQMEWPAQETMLNAAAVALHLAADGRITARGVLGPATQPAPPRRAYAGDPLAPHGTAWPDLTAAAEAALNKTQTVPGGARQFLGLLTMVSRRREVWEREIAFLQDNGVPPGFLPDAVELDEVLGTSSCRAPRG